MCSVVAAERARVLPVSAWHSRCAVSAILLMGAVAFVRRLRGAPLHAMLHPGHVKEIAEAIARLGGSVDETRRTTPPAGFIEDRIRMARTTAGLLISVSATPRPEGWVLHYALSRADGTMTRPVARALAALVIRLRPYPAPSHLIEGNDDVFHLLVFAPTSGPALATCT
jgi:hypothetical protein